MTKVKRLLQQFKPEVYDLFLDIDHKKLSFSGNVKITGTKTESGKSLSLHSKDLKIKSATIDGQEAKVSYGSQDEMILGSDKELSSGEHVIEVSFSGLATDTMHGIYQAPYTQDGKEKMVIATQLESHYARDAFPCIDEPMAKAVFNLTLSHDTEYVAISNMPVKSEYSKAGKTVKVFEPTPIMSTYLLAFVVGDYVGVETKTKHGVVLKAWSTPDYAEFLEFSLETGRRGLEFFEDYFGIKFPLPKCDFVGVPSFSAAAMENWGLITFREAAFIVDPNNTNLSRKQRIAETVIHELAHQWFGNLVTMEWWQDLWLNEGFASWAANFGVDKLFPDWNYWAQFIASDFSTTQAADSLPSSRAIEVKIDNPDEIRSIFDEISYSKGPVIVRMLHEFLGDEDFREGISHYLNKHSYANATTNDLWAALEEKSQKPVGRLMSAWTKQSGFPVLSLKSTDNGVRLEQSRFLITGKEDGKTWPVPVSHAKTEEIFLLEEVSQAWKTPIADFPKFNVGQSGLYIVDYPDDYLEEIKRQVAQQKMPAVDRLGVLDDLFQIARAGRGSTTDLLDLSFKLGKEESLVVWEAIMGQFGNIRRIMDDEDLIESMRPAAAKLSAYNMKRLGWEPKVDESSFDQLLRPLIIGLSAFGDNPETIKKLLAMFDQANKPEDIAPDLRGVVYGTAVRFGDQKTFDKLLNFYRETKSPQEKLSLSSALCSFKQTELINQAFELIKTEVKLQDTVYWFVYSFMNRHAKQMMWDWIKDNWNWIQSKFKEDLMTLNWIPEYASIAFASEEFLRDYKEFWQKNASKGVEREVNKGIETLTWQIAWHERDFKAVSNYFKNL